MTKVYIILLNYNSWQDTINCINSILASSYPEFQIVIIDNKSTDNSVSELKNWISIYPGNHTQDYLFNSKDFKLNSILNRISLILSNTNDGFASGNNIFLKKMIPGHLVWLLNPDTIIEKTCLSQLVSFIYGKKNMVLGATIFNFYYKNELLSIGGSKIIFPLGLVREIRNRNLVDQIDYIHGGCLMTYSDNFIQNGLLPENYFLYWEETDWCYSAKKKGLLLKVCETAIIYDKVGGVIGRGYFSDYYYSKNALKFISKYKGMLYTLLPIIFNLIRCVNKLIRLEPNRANAIFLATLDFIFKKNSFSPLPHNID